MEEGKDSRPYDKAYARTIEIVSGWWPWISKRKACALITYQSEMFEEEMKQTAEKRRERGKERHKYKVTIGYENFPWYCEVVQRGDWYLFCDGRKVMTIRHKDEKLDHTIHYREKVIEASDCYEAFKKVERNSKFHICSLEFEKLPTDGK